MSGDREEEQQAQRKKIHVIAEEPKGKNLDLRVVKTL